MIRSTRLCWVLVLCACSCVAQGADWFVRTTGSDSNAGSSPSSAFATVGRALAACAPGDTIYIGAGTYAASATYTMTSGGTPGSPVRIIGDTTGATAGDPGDVILSRSTAAHAFQLTNADYVRFDGLWFQGGLDAIALDSSVGIEVQDCRFSGFAESMVGVTNGSSVTVRSVQAESGKRGLLVSNGSVVIEDSAFAGLTGDGVYSANAGNTVEVRRTRFDTCVYGVRADNGTVTIINTLFTNITTNAVYTRNSTTLTMINCTADSIGSIGARFAGTSRLHNNIFSNIGSHCMQWNGGSWNVTHTIVFNKRGDISNKFNSPNEYQYDPQYANPTAGDYSLLPTSRAIDLGTDRSVNTTVDINSDPRPQGSGWDIGAYEADPDASSVPAPVPYSTAFSSLGLEWSGARTTNLSTGGSCLGYMGLVSGVNETVSLALQTVPGTAYQVVYDLILFDGWDFIGTEEDEFTVRIGGTPVHRPELSTSLAELTQNIGAGSASDRVYRVRSFLFEATETVTRIDFGATNTGDYTGESWGIDNLRVLPSSSAYASLPYANDFDGTIGDEWTSSRVETQSSDLGPFLGRFAVDNEHAALLGIETVPGQTYALTFDLYFLDSWDTNEEVRVMIDGREVISNFLGNGYKRPARATYAGQSSAEERHIGFSSRYIDTVFRRVAYRFTASSPRTTVSFHGTSNQTVGDESWGLDAVTINSGSAPRVVRWREVSSVDPDE